MNNIKSIKLYISESIIEKLKSQIGMKKLAGGVYSMSDEFSLLIINGLEKNAKNIDIKESKPVKGESVNSE